MDEHFRTAPMEENVCFYLILSLRDTLTQYHIYVETCHFNTLHFEKAFKDLEITTPCFYCFTIKVPNYRTLYPIFTASASTSLVLFLGSHYSCINWYLVPQFLWSRKLYTSSI